MAKTKTLYACTECGGEALKWQGQCPHCQAWNTLEETLAEAAPSANRFALIAEGGKLQRLSEVEAREEERIATGVPEFDRVLGGGLVAGGVVLIGGDPGIGKSTLLLQALAEMGATRKVLYISGEESPQQVALRARRLAVDARQVHECAAQLTRVAKSGQTSIIFIGHVTKEGALAGPRVLEHMVDTVLYFEGDTHSSFRLVRAIKNRFGAVNEIGVFAMTEKGLKGVANPSAIFLSQHAEPVPG